MKRIRGGLVASTLVAASLVVAVPATPALAATECATAVGSTGAGATGPSASGYVLNVSDLATAYTPPSPATTIAGFPGAQGIDTVVGGVPTTRVVTQFAQGNDGGAAASPGGVVSNDGGATFPASTYQSNNYYHTGVTLRDGTQFAMDYHITSRTDTSVVFQVYRSTDDGLTWTTSSATVNLVDTLQSGAGVINTSSPLELPDGTILITFYGKFAGDPAGFSRSVVAASTDGGLTFTKRGVIAKPASSTDTNSYNETAIAQLPNGNLFAAVRHHTGASTLAALRYAISSDGGATWSTPADLTIAMNGAAAAARLAVDPQLELLANGVLVLTGGRPDNFVAMSTNGLGTGWTGALIYRNCPTTGAATHGSSGYTGIAPIGSDRVAVLVDNCKPPGLDANGDPVDGCAHAGDSGFTVGTDYQVRRRDVDLLGPDVGKIDLATGYAQGRFSVATNMTWAGSGHPRAGVAAVFDGSTGYWSSAIGTGGATGEFTLTLDHTYQLTRIGLSLRNGRPESGRVWVSTDGVTWNNPVISATGRTDLALNYLTFATPTSARYVRVEVDPGTGCDAVLGTGCTFLNELELYSTVDSFENEPVNNRPRGFTTLSQTWVTGYEVGGSSAQALRLDDGSTDAPATAVLPGTATTTKTVQFAVRPVTLPNGFLFDLLGSSSSVAAYHFAVRPDGSIARWNGSVWVALTAAGVVPVGGWSTIGVTATTSSATIAVNGTTVATGIPVFTASSTLTGVEFASAGTAPTGDNILVDDVALGN